MSWNNLTDRQKDLDRAIEQCGIKLDSSMRCLKKVVSSIGATTLETNYVKERIELRLKTQEILNKTDDFIHRTESILNEFEKDDEEWRKRGRNIGFDF